MADNCAQSPVAREEMDHVMTQQLVADLVNKLASTTVCYWWKLLGDEPNSLCRFLDIPWKEMRLILRKCRVLYGASDSFKTVEYEKLMTRISCDYTTYRPSGKPEHFMKIGDKLVDVHAVERPKDMHSIGSGVLEKMPIVAVHVPGIRTKMSRRLASTLIAAVTEEVNSSASTSSSEDNTPDSSKPSYKGSMTIYIDDLISVIQNELFYASRQGAAYSFTQRAERMLRKAAAVAIKGSVRDMVDAWIERIGDDDKKEAFACMSTPALTTQRMFAATDELEQRIIFPTPATETPIVGRLPPSQPTFITPPLDLTDDADGDERDIDAVLSQLKEETMLQNSLHKRLSLNKQRALTLEHKNGRKFRVVLPPDSQSTKSFVEDAKKTHWVKDMLHTDTHHRGMLEYLASTQPEAYVRVANDKKIRVSTAVLNTPETLALGRLTGINDLQMSKMRSFLKNVGKADLKYNKKEIARIDNDVGLHKAMPDASFGNYMLEWAITKGKGNEKKLPESCSFWNCDMLLEVAAEIDLHLHTHFLEKPDFKIASGLLDYGAPGFINSPGIVVLFGGDHGAGACPVSLKLNLTSPQERKTRGELNYRCPTLQVASIDCSKDTFELLSNTVMPQLKGQMVQLRNSCAVVLFSENDPRRYRKVFLIPKNYDQYTAHVRGNQLVYRVGQTERTIDLNVYFETEVPGVAVPFHDFRIRKIVSNFNDLYVGDLAFLAMSIGMNNSAGAHCVHCFTKSSNFNCQTMHPQDARTKASLTNDLNSYNQQRLSRKSVRNYHGVNCVGFLDIDPQRIIVPILHCPMGLVDKVLVKFKEWVVFEVESMPEASHEIREAYRTAIEAHLAAISNENQARQIGEQAGNTPEIATLLKDAEQARKAARQGERKAKLNFEEMVKRHNSRVYSLSQAFDCTFRANNIKKEHCHGGKCNGVNCIRIMEQADELWTEFASSIKLKKIATTTDADVDAKCQRFAKMLGYLDVIWSNVRGIDAGLLPTNDQTQQLRKATAEGKVMWINMGLGTLQPKWHMTFDGHLLHQVIKHGGLADKSDETIELQHQILMRLRGRYRGITSYQRKETCIRRELRRRKSPEIQSHIDKFELSKKRKRTSERALAATERQQQQRHAKRVKREAVMEG